MQQKLSHLLLIPGLVLVILSFLPQYSVSSAPTNNVADNQPIINFPESITFQAVIQNDAPITSVVLEYGTDELTCGTVIAKAFPQFVKGKNVDVEWTWEMRQSGSLPPGTTIWWRWRYTDENRNEQVSPQKSMVWLDSIHNWRTISSGLINLHWYSGDNAFAEDLLNAAELGLARLEQEAGLQPENPVHLYIYANTSDMKDAILYEPGWTGGLAFPEHDIVIIGISQRDIEWGRETISHELTHVLVGHLTFSCLGSMPTWLSEGLAVYGEGGLDSLSQEQLDQAINSDQLLTVRSLSGGFSEIPGKAYLSYSQSYSIVKFLIESYGQKQMNSLLIQLRDGKTIDYALLDLYGFDVDGLEAAWRQAVGAAPKKTPALPTVQPTPTFVPTYVPYAGAPMAITPTPFAVPTSFTSGGPSNPIDRINSPPIALTIALLAVCCVVFLLFAVLGLGFFLSRQKRKGEHHETKI